METNAREGDLAASSRPPIREAFDKMNGALFLTKDEMRERPLDAMEFLNAERAEKAEKMLEVYTRAIDEERAAVDRIEAAVRELREAINHGALEYNLLTNVNIIRHPVVGAKAAGSSVTCTVVRVMR